MEDAPAIVTLREATQKAKREHACCMCKEAIPVGMAYRKTVYLDEDMKFQVAKYHIRCDTRE